MLSSSLKAVNGVVFSQSSRSLWCFTLFFFRFQSAKLCAIMHSFTQPQSPKTSHAGPERFGDVSQEPGWPVLLLHVFLRQQPVQNFGWREQHWQWESGRGVRKQPQEDWQNGCDSGHLGSTHIFDSCMDRLRAICGFHDSDWGHGFNHPEITEPFYSPNSVATLKGFLRWV